MKGTKQGLRLLYGAGFTALCAGAALADEPVVYTPDYFEQFAPQTAADMVARIPGFVIRGSEGGERGFGQASLNILINGRRPSTKSLGANDILSRISVDSVVRIEILDGTALDIPGLSGDVANIVQQAFGVSGTWDIAARFEDGTEPQFPDGEVVVNVTRGDVTGTLNLDFGQFTYTEDGEETFFGADGAPLQERVEDLVFENQRPSVNASLSWTPPSGNILNLNGELQVQNRNFDIRERFVAASPDGTDGQSLFFDGEDEIEYELGGDYSFDAGPGRLKAIGLYRYEDSEFTNRFADFTVGRDVFTQEFLQDIEEVEAIGRLEYTLGGGAWQIAGEYAYNELTAENVFNGTDLPGVEVNEDRLQATLSHNRKIGDWDVQAVAGLEYSEIGVPSSPASESRTFYRPKGTLSASRDLGSKYRLVFKGERQVGQLNFFDFVTDLDLEEGRDDAGNTRIVPDQTWFIQASLERTDPDLFSWRLAPELGIIDDPIDRIRFADGTEGPGNLDSRAYFYGVTGNFTYILDRAVEGMRLEGSFNATETDIEDPLSKDRRRFNGASPFSGSLELRHDIENTPWAYELGYSYIDSPVRAFRFDEASSFEFSSGQLRAAVEHKDFFGMNLEVVATNLLDEKGTRIREVFGGDRFGPFLLREERERARGRRISVILSDTF